MPLKPRLHLAAILVGEMHRQRGNVFAMLAQGRQRHRNHIQPVIEVLPEFAGLDRLLQVLVRCGDHAGVKRQQAVAPEPLEFTLLQDPQQLACNSGAISPISSSNKRSVLSRFKLALLGRQPRR